MREDVEGVIGQETSHLAFQEPHRRIMHAVFKLGISSVLTKIAPDKHETRL